MPFSNAPRLSFVALPQQFPLRLTELTMPHSLSAAWKLTRNCNGKLRRTMNLNVESQLYGVESGEPEDRIRRVAGQRFALFLTPNFPAGQRKTALNRHFYALSDRR